jgi:hypothetical protein
LPLHRRLRTATHQQPDALGIGFLGWEYTHDAPLK